LRNISTEIPKQALAGLKGFGLKQEGDGGNLARIVANLEIRGNQLDEDEDANAEAQLDAMARDMFDEVDVFNVSSTCPR
jgi:hypothetical protein